LDFLNFPKTFKNRQNASRSDQNQQINTEMIQKCKIYFKKVTIFFIKKREIQNSEKTACQKVVAIIT